MLTLNNIARVKKELRLFERDIKNIQNISAREKGLKLLSQLISYINMINQGHNFSEAKKIDPINLREAIEETIKIRRSISKLIKDSKS